MYILIYTKGSVFVKPDFYIFLLWKIWEIIFIRLYWWIDLLKRIEATTEGVDSMVMMLLFEAY